MILTEKFVWFHIGKTAGKATIRLIKYVLDEIGESYEQLKFHHILTSDDPRVENKLLVSNIRRLPEWYLSYAHHRRIIDNVPVPPADCFVEGDYTNWFYGGSGHDMTGNDIHVPFRILADSYLKHMRLLGEHFHWIRAEYYPEDALKFLKKLYPIGEALKKRVYDNFVVKEEHEYAHNVRDFFTNEQINMMYINNPSWAELERQYYGDYFA